MKRTLALLFLTLFFGVVLSLLAMSKAGWIKDLLPQAKAQVVAQTYTNPLYPGADPQMEFADGYYYYVHTEGTVIDVIRAESMVDLQHGIKRVRVYTAPASGPAAHEIWAPEIHHLNNKWYIYFAADSGSDISHRMFVLEGDNPLGPYTFKGQLKPYDAPNAWAIDGTVFRHTDGKLYFVWSGRPGTDTSYSQHIYIAPMSNPYTISGNRISLSAPTYAWEEVGGAVNEGPAVLQRNGKTFITYSASLYVTPDYKLGMLTNTDGNVLRAASWVKSPNPVFQKTDKVFGPGHNAFIKSPDGKEDWIIYHARDDTSSSSPRTTRAQKFTWNSNGTPYFGSPVAPGVELPLPSGDSYGDLVIDSFVLTDSQGNVKTHFDPGEAIYPKVTIRNGGNKVVYTTTGSTDTTFYANAPQTVAANTPPDVNVTLKNGEFDRDFSKTYASNPQDSNNWYYNNARSWSKSDGNYTARVFVNDTHDGVEGDYNNNQAVVSYTVGNPPPTPTPTPARPDLTIQSLQLTDSNGNPKTSFRVNEPIYAKITVANLTGFSSSGIARTQIYKNQPNTVAFSVVSDIPMDIKHGTFYPNGNYTYGSYPGGQWQSSFEGSTSFTMSTPGTYTARGLINFDQAVAENNYNNNQVAVTYTIVPETTPTPTPQGPVVAMPYTNPPSGLTALQSYDSRRVFFKTKAPLHLSQAACFACGSGSRIVLYQSDSNASFGSQLFDLTSKSTEGSWTSVVTPALTLQANSYYILRYDPAQAPTYYGKTQTSTQDIDFLKYSTYTAPSWNTGAFEIRLTYTK
jgi:GH43 family beta-xylosidase